MLKLKPPKPINTDLISFKDNYVGTSVNKLYRIKALNLLVDVKNTDADKIKRGYIWVCIAKTCKLIHPNKLSAALVDGYKQNIYK